MTEKNIPMNNAVVVAAKLPIKISGRPTVRITSSIVSYLNILVPIIFHIVKRKPSAAMNANSIISMISVIGLVSIIVYVYESHILLCCLIVGLPNYSLPFVTSRWACKHFLGGISRCWLGEVLPLMRLNSLGKM